jgi:hypothetical protein
VKGFLKPNERLVRTGKTDLRAPDGTPLPAVPQYMIVAVEDADPACVEPLGADERLILAGTAQTERANAEDRYAAMLAGREQPPRAGGVPFYIKEGAENINPKTGLSLEEEKAVEPLIGDMVDAFGQYARKMKALAKQGKAAAEGIKGGGTIGRK